MAGKKLYGVHEMSDPKKPDDEEGFFAEYLKPKKKKKKKTPYKFLFSKDEWDADVLDTSDLDLGDLKPYLESLKRPDYKYNWVQVSEDEFLPREDYPELREFIAGGFSKKAIEFLENGVSPSDLEELGFIYRSSKPEKPEVQTSYIFHDKPPEDFEKIDPRSGQEASDQKFAGDIRKAKHGVPEGEFHAGEEPSESPDKSPDGGPPPPPGSEEPSDESGIGDFLADWIKKYLGNDYQDIQWFNGGRTKACFIATYQGIEERVIKIDLDLPETGPAVDAINKGYNSAHDAKMRMRLNQRGLKPRNYQGPITEHNIPRVITFAEKEGVTFLIEDFFPHDWSDKNPARTLTDYVKDEGPLNLDNFENVFAQLIDAVGYVSSCNMYHRDIKPENILINSTLELRLTDFGMACDKDEPKAKFSPSAGSRDVMDFGLCPIFTGEDSKYDDRSEVYEVGMNMLYALTGSMHIKYDRDEKNPTAIILSTGESLLDENGKIKHKVHDNAVQEAVKQIPDEIRKKYGKVIKKCLAADPNERYKTVEDFIVAFQKAQYGDIIQTCIDADPEEKYKTSEEFIEAFHEQKCPVYGESKNYKTIDQFIAVFEKEIGPEAIVKAAKKKLAKKLAVLSVLGLSVAIPSAVYLLQQNDSLEEEVEQAEIMIAEKQAENEELEAASKRMNITPKWNEDGEKIVNDYITLTVNAVNNENNTERVKDGEFFPERDGIRVSPGGKISLDITAIRKALPEKYEPYLLFLDGIAYIEGFRPQSFTIEPSRLKVPDEIHLNMGKDNVVGTVDVPEHIKDGTYNLVVSILAPSHVYKKRLDFGEEGTVINMVKIPILIGDPTENAYVKGLKIKPFSPPRFTVDTLNVLPVSATPKDVDVDDALEAIDDFFLDDDLIYEVSVPDEGYKKFYKGIPEVLEGLTKYFLLPHKGKDDEEKVLQILVRDPKNGEIIHYSFAPIKYMADAKWKDVGLPGDPGLLAKRHKWGLSVPTGEFAMKLIPYMQKLYANPGVGKVTMDNVTTIGDLIPDDGSSN